MRPHEERRQLVLRIPPHIYEAIGHAAWREQRSLNAEVVWAIRCYLAARFPEAAADRDRNDITPIAN